MPHRINVDSINQSVFTLKHLAAGSNHICKGLKIDRTNDDNPFDWQYYSGWMKSLVSKILIETSINVRVMQDFLREHLEDSTAIQTIESEINNTHTIGLFSPKLTPIPIREAFNKIIHAQEMTLVWIDQPDESGSYEFWNGTINLDGTFRGDPWSCQLFTEEFCFAVEDYLMRVENSVDWYHIYKYDE